MFDAPWFFPDGRDAHLKVVEDYNKDLVIELSIRAFPTFRFYLDGTQVDETRGANIQEVARKVRLCFVADLDEKRDVSFRFVFVAFRSVLLVEIMCVADVEDGSSFKCRRRRARIWV